MLSLNIQRWFSPAIMSFLMALLSLQFVACGTIQKQEPSTESTSPTYKPVTIHNCGQTFTFTRAPMRVISTMQNTTDILLALGLESDTPQRLKPCSFFHPSVRGRLSMCGIATTR
jgi:ABC-type Fe3+-hydroxamate transport system substrate-binding protein